MHFYPGVRPGKLTLRTYLRLLRDVRRVARLFGPNPQTIDGLLDDMEQDDD